MVKILKIFFSFLVFGQCFFLSRDCSAQIEIPRLVGPVTDLVAMLSTEQRAQLDSRILALEKEKGSQIAVLILPSVMPEDIAQFGIRLADAWKIGRKGIADGVILIIAQQDRKMRIEVGRGLEGAVTDAMSKRIIAEQIAPHFKQGNFYQGVSAGVDALILLIKGEPLPIPEKATPAIDFQMSIFFIFIGLMLVSFFRFLGVHKGVAGFFGAGVAAILGYALILGVGSALITWILTLVFGLAESAAGQGPAYYRGRRSSSVWGSGGFSGGGFSGGGFSGGGGSFGGGGASGGW